jgi:hypothetical protein
MKLKILLQDPFDSSQLPRSNACVSETFLLPRRILGPIRIAVVHMSKTVYMAAPTFPIRPDSFDMFSAQLEADRFMTCKNT